MTLLSLKALKIYVSHNIRIFLVRNNLTSIKVDFDLFYCIVQRLFCIKSAYGRADNENNAGDINIQIIFLGVKFKRIFLNLSSNNNPS